MVDSPVLGIPEIQDTNTPEVEANGAVNILEAAANSTTNLAVAASPHVVLSTSYNRFVSLRFTNGGIAAPFNVLVPSTNPRLFVVRNASGQVLTIGVNNGSGGFLGTTVEINDGQDFIIYSDATNLVAVGGGGGLSEVSDEGGAIVIDAVAMDFVGDGVTVSDGGAGIARVSIPGDVFIKPGPLEYLSSVELAGQSTVSFPRIGNADHIELMIVFENVRITNDNIAWGIALNYGAGFETSYKRANAELDSGAIEDNNVNQTASFIPIAVNQGNAAAEAGSGRAYISAPFVAGAQKLVSGVGAHHQNDGDITAANFGMVSAAGTSTALTGIRAQVQTTTFVAGRAHLYGLRAANSTLAIAGAPGPWRHIATKTFSAVSQLDIEDFVDGKNYVELAFRIKNLTVTTDDAAIRCRFKLNGTYQAGASSYALNSGASDTADAVTNEGFGFTLDEGTIHPAVTTWGIGNAANEFMSGRLEIVNPLGSTHKRLQSNLIWTRPSGAVARSSSSVMYSGTDFASALGGLRLYPEPSGTMSGVIEVFGLLAENPVVSPGGVPSPVIQHVHSRDDNTRTTASSTYVTATAAVTITPKSTAHRVRIRVSTTVASSNATGGVYLTLFRDGVTDLTPAGRDAMAAYANELSLPIQQYFEFVDSPATIGSVTYNLFFKTNGLGTAAIGGRSADTAFDTYTMMVAEEILDDGEVAVSPVILTSPFNPGAPAASEVMLSHRFTRDVDFPLNFAGSQFTAGVAATASTVFDVQKNGASVGTLTFAAAGTVATFAVNPAVSFAPGDLLRVIAPGAPDATLADLDITLAGLTAAVD